MQESAPGSLDAQARDFLDAWFEVRRIVQALNFNHFQNEGLSASQFILLGMVGEAGGACGAADLARRLNVDVTTTMRTADSLVARGLVARRRSAQDRRRSELALTDAGREAHARLQRLFVERVRAGFQAMPAELRAGLLDGLRGFVTAMAGS
jgi:DNA-binding MarR family transcriptional regulator